MKNNICVLILFAIVVGTGQQGKAQPTHLIEIGITDSLYSDILEEQREIWVQLPENYNPNSRINYPVVYLLDGGVQMPALAAVYGYYWGGFMPEMILVGISNRTNRTRDLTTSKIEMRRGERMTGESGGAETFTNFIEKELIPYVDSKYQTTSYRTLIGHSYAGLFTINTLINHAHLFENYIAIDPSLEWDKQKLLKEAKLKLQEDNLEGKSLFVSLSGQLHMQNEAINIKNVMEDTSEYTLFSRSIIEFSRFAENQKQNGMNFYWKYYENDLHGTVPLPSILDGLIYLFNWYQIEHTDKFNSPETPIEELIQVIKNREKKLRDHFGYTVPPFDEELLTMLGYMNLDWEQYEKSLTFFQFAVEYYPGSANAYDSLADYYESQEDAPNAIKSVAKAYEISGSDYHKNRLLELESNMR